MFIICDSSIQIIKLQKKTVYGTCIAADCFSKQNNNTNAFHKMFEYNKGLVITTDYLNNKKNILMS